VGHGQGIKTMVLTGVVMRIYSVNLLLGWLYVWGV